MGGVWSLSAPKSTLGLHEAVICIDKVQASIATNSSKSYALLIAFIFDFLMSYLGIQGLSASAFPTNFPKVQNGGAFGDQDEGASDRVEHHYRSKICLYYSNLKMQ